MRPRTSGRLEGTRTPTPTPTPTPTSTPTATLAGTERAPKQALTFGRTADGRPTAIYEASTTAARLGRRYASISLIRRAGGHWGQASPPGPRRRLRQRPRRARGPGLKARLSRVLHLPRVPDLASCLRSSRNPSTHSPRSFILTHSANITRCTVTETIPTGRV